MNLFKTLVQAIKDKRKDRRFLKRKFHGYELVIPENKMEALYSKKYIDDLKFRDYTTRTADIVYTSIPEVVQWCQEAKGVVQGDFKVENDFTPKFKFSRKEVAKEFQNKFLS